MMLFRLSTQSVSQVVDGLITHIRNLKKMIESNTFNTEKMVEPLNVQDLQKILNNISGVARPEAKCKMISDVVFGALTANVLELTKQAEVSKKALSCLIRYILLNKLADDYSNISWSAFTNFLTGFPIKCNEPKVVTSQHPGWGPPKVYKNQH